MIQRRDLDDEMLALIRRVARNLSRGDSHLAEELEQETILTALSNRPSDPRFMEPWLRKIAWNRLFTHRAREARSRSLKESRQVQEAAVVRDDTDPATESANDELRDELRRRVAALPEIYRRAVTLRVLDGLPPRDVAKELDLPVETVRTRVRRGLELLRTEIGPEDRWAGLRAAWAAIPFLRSKKMVAALGLVSAAGVAVALQPSIQLATPVSLADRVDSTQGPPEPSALVAQAPASRELIGSAVLEDATPKPAPSAVPNPDERAFAVQVVDAMGLPVPGTAVFARWGIGVAGAQRLGTTNADGQLRILVPTTGCWLAARGEPGQLSDSIYLDQPRLDHSSLEGSPSEGAVPVQLELKERDVAWVQILGADAGLTDAELPAVGPGAVGPGADRRSESELTVQLWPADVRKKIQLCPGSGLFGVSSWVPAWAEEGGRYGLAWGDMRKSVIVARGDEPLWWGPLQARGAAAPETIDLRDAWEITGRVVTSDGLPVEGYPVFVPAQADLGARRHGQNTTTGSRGQFRVGALASGAASVLIGSDLQLRAARPSVGTGLRSVDLGDIDLGRLHVDQGTRVFVSGFQGPVKINAIHTNEQQLWTAYRLANPECKLIDARGDVESNGWADIHESASDLASIVVTGVHEQTGETVRLFRTRPHFPAEVLIEGPLPAPAIITLENPVPGRAGRLLLVERRSGFRRSVAIPAGPMDGRSCPVRIPVSPGCWDCFFQSPSGEILSRKVVKLRPGATVDFGVFSGATGTIQFDWSELEGNGRPHDQVTVRLLRGSEVVTIEEVERSRLSERWASRTDMAGNYRVVARAARELYSGFLRVRDKEQGTLALKKDLIVLEVRLLMKPKSPGIPAGTIDILSASGELIERKVIEGNPELGRLRILVPNAKGVRLMGNFAGVLVEGAVERDSRSGFGTVALRPKLTKLVPAGPVPKR